MIIHATPLAGYLLIKTLIARQQPTSVYVTVFYRSDTTFKIHYQLFYLARGDATITY